MKKIVFFILAIGVALFAAPNGGLKKISLSQACKNIVNNIASGEAKYYHAMGGYIALEQNKKTVVFLKEIDGRCDVVYHGTALY